MPFDDFEQEDKHEILIATLSHCHFIIFSIQCELNMNMFVLSLLTGCSMCDSEKFAFILITFGISNDFHTLITK